MSGAHAHIFERRYKYGVLVEYRCACGVTPMEALGEEFGRLEWAAATATEMFARFKRLWEGRQ